MCPSCCVACTELSWLPESLGTEIPCEKYFGRIFMSLFRFPFSLSHFLTDSLPSESPLFSLSEQTTTPVIASPDKGISESGRSRVRTRGGRKREKSFSKGKETMKEDAFSFTVPDININVIVNYR